jgi:hypothetical protein
MLLKAWWNAAETTPVFPTNDSVQLFTQWMQEFSIGRKRILDTMLASLSD